MIMDYEDFRGKILEIISNNRRFAKIKDIYESEDMIIVKTVDDLEYEMTPKEFKVLSQSGYVDSKDHILYYIHDSLPEGFFLKEMSQTEKLWRTLNRIRDYTEDLHGVILHYFFKTKYWINNEKREENAKKILKELSDINIESGLRSLLCKLQSLSDDINYPDFNWSED